MRSCPSKAAEGIVAIFVPPACREEVLGDLHERYRSPLQYALEAILTVPWVIFSRVRRTTDPQVLLVQAFGLYASFIGAAWLTDKALLREQWGFLRLGIPAGVELLGLVLADAFAQLGRHPTLEAARGPAVGVVLALAAQGMLWANNSILVIPLWVMLYGGALSLLLSSAIRLLFPPASAQVQGANAPAFWLRQGSGAGGSAQAFFRVLKAAAAVFMAIVVGWLMVVHSTLPRLWIVPLLVVISIAVYVAWKRT